jgi:hypothetical protein
MKCVAEIRSTNIMHITEAIMTFWDAAFAVAAVANEDS